MFVCHRKILLKILIKIRINDRTISLMCYRKETHSKIEQMMKDLKVFLVYVGTSQVPKYFSTETNTLR